MTDQYILTDSLSIGGVRLDCEWQISYLNPACKNSLKKYQSALPQRNATFGLEQLLGSRFDESINQSGHSLENIVSASQEVNALIRDIASTTQGQNENIESMNQQVNYLKSSVKENQEMVQSVGEISSNMEADCDKLSKLGGKFDVGIQIVG